MKKISILGAGESAIGAALLAQKKGFEVFVSDSNAIAFNYKKILLENKIKFEENGHNEERLFKSDQIIKSPGISNEAFIIKKIKALGLSIISEILFAKSFSQAKCIAITGTNGKTTTSYLCHHTLKEGGYDVKLAGNMGKSFAESLLGGDSKYYVLEISSFQLDDSPSFDPSIAILLNISPDHLDRYGGKFENYINSKWQITSNLTSKDFFIYNYDDPIILKKLKESPPRGLHLPFSLKEKFKQGAYLKKNKLIFQFEDKKYEIDPRGLPLKGVHNLYNVMAAGLASIILNLDKKALKDHLISFEPLAHRLELVLTKNGVEFINDSKATNVHALRYALEAVNAPIILIAGGIDKGNDYQELIPLLKKVKALIVLGKENQKLIEAFKDHSPFFCTTTMKEALQKAYEISKSGDKILLSPACSSFDWFKDYKDRGDQFKKEAKLL